MIGRLQTNRFLKNLKVIAMKIKEKQGKIISSGQQELKDGTWKERKN